jgi:hypothetical protein
MKGVDGDLDFPCASRAFVLVPEGETLEAGFVRAERGTVAGNPKVFLIFYITTPGPSHGMELFLSCSVAPGGRWARSSKFYMSWMLAAGNPPARRDRLSTAIFRGKMFRIRTKTVRRTWLHVALPTRLQYSVIDALLEVTAGGAPALAPSRTVQKIGSLRAPDRKEKKEA